MPTRALPARSLQEELGAAGLTKRPTSCMLVLPKPVKGEAPKDDEAKEYAELFAEVGRAWLGPSACGGAAPAGQPMRGCWTEQPS